MPKATSVDELDFDANVALSALTERSQGHAAMSVPAQGLNLAIRTSRKPNLGWHGVTAQEQARLLALAVR